MDGLSVWFLAAGSLLLLMAVIGAAIERLPVSPAIVYLAFGFLLGPGAFGLLEIDLESHRSLIRAIAEVGVVLSLFSVGLRLGVPLRDSAWRVPLLLVGPAMVLTIAGGALAAWAIFGLGAGAAILLASIVAPTDPVLASELQLKHPTERDRVRFGLTAEGGMNDGLAAVGIVLGLALLDPVETVAPAIVREIAWSVPAGVVLGALCGTAFARVALGLRRRDRSTPGLEVFLVLGLIALAYGLASMVRAEGFLAVFAAGVAVRRIERRASAQAGPSAAAQETAGAPAAMAHELLVFNRQIERIAEVVVVVMAGALLDAALFDWRAWAFAIVMLLVVRPAAVALGVAGAPLSPRERRLLQWFGVRGIGSLYWLAFALEREAAGADTAVLATATLTVIAASVLAHGVSATPVMDWHLRRRRA